MIILVVIASVSGQAVVDGGGLAGMSLKGGAKKPELAKLLCENSVFEGRREEARTRQVVV